MQKLPPLAFAGRIGQIIRLLSGLCAATAELLNMLVCEDRPSERASEGVEICSSSTVEDL